LGALLAGAVQIDRRGVADSDEVGEWIETGTGDQIMGARDIKPDHTPPPVPPQYRKENPLDRTPDYSQPNPVKEPAGGDSTPSSPVDIRQAHRQSARRSSGRTLRPWFYGVVVAMVILSAFWWNDHAFKVMTPAQHLSRARLAAKEHDIDLALRHAKAVQDGAPEASEARELFAAQEAVLRSQRATQQEAQQWLDADRQKQEAQWEAQEQRVRQEQEARIAAVRELGNQLKDLGYDVTVSISREHPDEITITSADFANTEPRLRFLAFIRGRRSPMIDACAAGFQFVRLRSRAILGFSESYPLTA
jgi:hypothetical protein